MPDLIEPTDLLTSSGSRRAPSRRSTFDAMVPQIVRRKPGGVCEVERYALYCRDQRRRPPE